MRYIMVAAAPKPEDRLAFADKLANIRAKDVEGKYKKQLQKLEVEYQFILLRSLDLFHKEMLRAKLPESLHEIKEKLTDTAGEFTYQTNLSSTNWNWNNIICRNCRKKSLKPMLATNELCCENCGLLETLGGVAFDYEELYKCGDYKVVKQRRSTRRYNFRHYLEKHVGILSKRGHILSYETIEKANEFFEGIDEQLPKRISMAFVAFQILRHVVQPKEEKYILNYFRLQVPQSSVRKHAEKWEHMLRQFDAQGA